LAILALWGMVNCVAVFLNCCHRHVINRGPQKPIDLEIADRTEVVTATGIAKEMSSVVAADTWAVAPAAPLVLLAVYMAVAASKAVAQSRDLKIFVRNRQRVWRISPRSLVLS